MAIKFHLPDGSETDMVINSLKFFLVSNGEDFRDMSLAIAASRPGHRSPTKFEQFASAILRCRPQPPPSPHPKFRR